MPPSLDCDALPPLTPNERRALADVLERLIDEREPPESKAERVSEAVGALFRHGPELVELLRLGG